MRSLKTVAGLIESAINRVISEYPHPNSVLLNREVNESLLVELIYKHSRRNNVSPEHVYRVIRGTKMPSNILNNQISLDL